MTWTYHEIITITGNNIFRQLSCWRCHNPCITSLLVTVLSSSKLENHKRITLSLLRMTFILLSGVTLMTDNNSSMEVTGFKGERLSNTYSVHLLMPLKIPWGTTGHNNTPPTNAVLGNPLQLAPHLTGCLHLSVSASAPGLFWSCTFVGPLKVSLFFKHYIMVKNTN